MVNNHINFITLDINGVLCEVCLYFAGSVLLLSYSVGAMASCENNVK